jgi:hypothetical protein
MRSSRAATCAFDLNLSATGRNRSQISPVRHQQQWSQAATGDEGATDSVTFEDGLTDALADEDGATDSATGGEAELDIT